MVWQCTYSLSCYGDVLGNAFEDNLVVDATIANSDAQRDALWEVRESSPVIT